jgi:hypothetical protein
MLLSKGVSPFHLRCETKNVWDDPGREFWNFHVSIAQSVIRPIGKSSDDRWRLEIKRLIALLWVNPAAA